MIHRNFPVTGGRVSTLNAGFIPSLRDRKIFHLVLLHLASLHQFATERAGNVSMELLVVLVQLRPGDGLVALGAQGDVPGTVEAVHHVALPGDVSPARILEVRSYM